MASLRRERLFKEYQNRKYNADKMLRATFLMLALPTGLSFAALDIYYFIKALSLLVGGYDIFGTMITNSATGGNEKAQLLFEVPYLFMGYLFTITLLSCISFLFRRKNFTFVLLAIYAVSFVYGLVTMYNQSMDIAYSILLMLYSGYGMWVCDINLRQYKELKFLSKQDGYPDFVELLGSPEPIANTRGVYMRQYQKLKEQAHQRTKEKIASNDSDSCVDIKEHLTDGSNDSAMDELTTDFSQPIEELLKKAK